MFLFRKHRRRRDNYGLITKPRLWRPRPEGCVYLRPTLPNPSSPQAVEMADFECSVGAAQVTIPPRAACGRGVRGEPKQTGGDGRTSAAEVTTQASSVRPAGVHGGHVHRGGVSRASDVVELAARRHKLSIVACVRRVMAARLIPMYVLSWGGQHAIKVGWGHACRLISAHTLCMPPVWTEKKGGERYLQERAEKPRSAGQ